MNEEIENIRESYFNAVMEFTDENDILDLLPLPSQSNFSDLIMGILCLLKKELGEYEEVYHESSDLGVVNEIQKLQWKIKLIFDYHEKKLKEYNESQTELLTLPEENLIGRQLIFGKNLMGSVPFLDDIKKNIPREFYIEVFNLIESLKYEDVFSFSKVKWKKLSENSDLKGLFELKAFKIRIIVKMISKDIFYVEQVRIKKDDNSRKDRMEPFNRKKALERDFESVYKRIKEKSNLDELWQENDDIINQIYDLLGIDLEKEGINR